MNTLNRMMFVGTIKDDLKFAPWGNDSQRMYGVVVGKKMVKDKGEVPIYLSVKAFGTRAEEMRGKFRAGQIVLVEGEPSVHVWPDKNTGEKKSCLECVVVAMTALSGGGSSNEPDHPDVSDPFA